MSLSPDEHPLLPIGCSKKGAEKGCRAKILKGVMSAPFKKRCCDVITPFQMGAGRVLHIDVPVGQI